MHYTKYRIGHYVSDVKLLVQNSMSQPVVKKAVNRYGYDEAMLKVLKGLNEELSAVLIEQESAKIKKRDLYAERARVKNYIQKAYMKYLKLARIAFAEDLKVREALLLDGERARTYNDWFFQVTVFCSNLLTKESWLNVMSRYGIVKDEIIQLDTSLKNLNRITETCIGAQGEVRRLTGLKSKKVLELQNHVSDYVKIARIALEKTPQLLESIGIGAKS